jgi:hypothetical protein
MDKYIWYAAYGSNLYYPRFLLYIQGGELTQAGINKHYPGCTNKEPPVKKDVFVSHHTLYFSCRSKTWENGLDATDPSIPPVTIEEIKKQGYAWDGPNDYMWYGRMLYCCSMKAGYPVITFTSKRKDTDIIYTAPGKKYLTTIIRGLAGLNLSVEETAAYLISKNGIAGNYT